VSVSQNLSLLHVSEFSLENEVLKTKWQVVWENSAPMLRLLLGHVIVFGGEIWVRLWENSAPTLWPLSDSCVVFSVHHSAKSLQLLLGAAARACCASVGKFRKIVAAIAGFSSARKLCTSVGKFRKIIVAAACEFC
jgi:hypothetical protein